MTPRQKLILELCEALEPEEATVVALEIIDRLVDTRGWDEIKAMMSGPNRAARRGR